MTANLDRMVKFRDLQVAEDFARMAELGYMDRAYIFYGCAYYDQGRRWYLLSSDLERLEEILETKPQWYPTPIMQLQKSCPVPLGQEEKVAQQFKRQLALRLQASYSIHFFRKLQQWAAKPNTDDAYPLLESLREQLEGLYDQDRLQCFAGLVELAASGKVLSSQHSQYFQVWLDKMRRQMADDVIVSDVFEKTFYGLAFKPPGEAVGWYSNARIERVRQRQAELEAEGALVSPILVKTIGYNYTYRLEDAHCTFKDMLQKMADQNYLALVCAIKELPAAVEADALQKEIERLRETKRLLEAEALTSYGRRWHVHL